MRLLTTALICVLSLAIPSPSAEWPNWRGPAQNGTALSGTFPATWEPETALWTLAIPGKGFSTPVVRNKIIYLTTGTDGRDTVLAASGGSADCGANGPAVGGR